MRDIKEKTKHFLPQRQKDGPFCGQCNRFNLIKSKIEVNASDPDQILSQLAFNGLSGRGQRLCSADNFGVENDSCQKLAEFSPRACGDCSLFHPDITTEGVEAGITGTIIVREEPKENNIKYGKLGCFDDVYGGLSLTPCTELDKFQPKKSN